MRGGEALLEKLFRSGETVESPDGETLHTEGNGWSSLLDIFSLKRQDEVTPSNSTTFNTVYACVNVLSDDIAKLPMKVYQKVDGKIERKTEHPADYLLNKRPNPYMTPFIFKKLLMTSVLTRGNFFALIEFDNRGLPVQLLPLNPSTTTYNYDPVAKESFFRTTIGNRVVELQDYEVWHVKNLSEDGMMGQSPITVLKNQIEASRAADNLNKDIVDSGGVPRGILKVQGSIGNTAKDRVREEWNNRNSAGGIAVIDNGLEYQRVGFTQSDMQFIEAQKYNQQQIAAVFKVPLHKINQLDHATYTNIEHQSLDYVKNTLQPWIVQIEEEGNYKLFSNQENKKGYYIKTNMDSELRGDAESRARVQEIKMRNSLLSVNEGRAQDEMSPFDLEIANEPLATLNYTPLSRLVDYQYKDINNNLLKKPQGEGGDDTG